MTITIIGWYGTETIGDRAILAGIINLFSEILPAFDIKLGSIVPEFSQRTLLEDSEYYIEISNRRLNNISIFNSLAKRELKRAVKNSDLVIVGGGPLMDIIPMYMLNYAFKYAKKKGIPTAIVGCGWGPLKTPEYISVAKSLVQHSDITIFRDSTSLNECLAHLNDAAHCDANITSAIDPAFFCADFYRKNKSDSAKEEYIAVNFRDISNDQYGGDSEKNEKMFTQIIKSIIDKYDIPVHLVPMHSYFIGGDDRSLFNKIAFSLKDARIKVHNDPPSLTEVMSLYKNARFCIGMRFHSIVLQTILNGKNIILDYTDPNNGKIIGMMNELNLSTEYKNRYYSLINHNNDSISITEPDTFEIKPDTLLSHKNTYKNLLRSLLGNG
ncbi:MAG: polysaccharide pyruvyl transferase family protein [Bacteroides sp.]|nr:polysaccharide pyruvyl transferase family protein [Bacteroides sp.]